MNIIGKPADRQDGRLKVTGGAKYAAEFDLPGCVHAALVLSPISRGRVRGFDLSELRAVPGVLAVLTHENMPKLAPLSPTIAQDIGTIPGENRLPLQDAEIGYSGQIIACVIADTLERARDAAGRVHADIEVLPPFVEMHSAPKGEKAGAPKDAGAPAAGQTSSPEKFFGFEEAQTVRGNPDQAFGSAAKKFEAEYTTPHEHHNPIEQHAIIASWDSAGNLTVYVSSQSTKGPQRILSHAFGLPEAKVRAVAHFVGGGFGNKGTGAWPHEILCAVAARRVMRPVKLVLRRQDMFTLVGHRGACQQTLRLATDQGGAITVLSHETLTDANPGNEFFEPCGLTSRMLYAAPHFKMAHEVAQVNIAPPIFMRAPGESPGMWALESAMDEMAHQAGLDPVAFRVLNHADTHPQQNKPWSSKHLKACYERGQQLIGWDKRKAEPRAAKEGRYFIGYGMASATYPGYRQPAAAQVRLYPDGRAIASSSGTDIGTGAYTVFRQVAAETLGYPLERVVFEMGDSNLPFAPVAGGSQLTASVAPAVQEACERAMNDVAQLALADKASPIYNRTMDEIAFTEGRVHLKSDGSKGEALTEIVRRSGKPFVEHCVRKETMMSAKMSQSLKQSQRAPCTPVQPQSEVDADQDKYAFQSFGAQFCRVRVDEELGTVRVMDWATVLDVGRVLNPKTARSQVLGGVTFGIGMALMEETYYHPQNGRVGQPGRPVVRNLADYHVASHADVPPIQVAFIDTPDPHINALGARGIGEIGITGVAAAIGNAVFNATGKRIRELPIVPEKVMQTAS